MPDARNLISQPLLEDKGVRWESSESITHLYLQFVCAKSIPLFTCSRLKNSGQFYKVEVSFQDDKQSIEEPKASQSGSITSRDQEEDELDDPKSPFNLVISEDAETREYDRGEQLPNAQLKHVQPVRDLNHKPRADRDGEESEFSPNESSSTQITDRTSPSVNQLKTSESHRSEINFIGNEKESIVSDSADRVDDQKDEPPIPTVCDQESEPDDRRPPSELPEQIVPFKGIQTEQKIGEPDIRDPPSLQSEVENSLNVRTDSDVVEKRRYPATVPEVHRTSTGRIRSPFHRWAAFATCRIEEIRFAHPESSREILLNSNWKT